MNQILKAELLAKQWHDVDANQKYNGHQYSIHLQLVYNVGVRFSHLLPDCLREDILVACWLHDAIEDARITYNTINEAFGKRVAEIVFAVTNEKGRNRKERANDKYYWGIKTTAGAVFVKMCDRIANIEASIEGNSPQLSMYEKENDNFIKEMGLSEMHEMVKYLRSLFQPSTLRSIETDS